MSVKNSPAPLPARHRQLRLQLPVSLIWYFPVSASIASIFAEAAVVSTVETYPLLVPVLNYVTRDRAQYYLPNRCQQKKQLDPAEQ